LHLWLFFKNSSDGSSTSNATVPSTTIAIPAGGGDTVEVTVLVTNVVEFVIVELVVVFVLKVVIVELCVAVFVVLVVFVVLLPECVVVVDVPVVLAAMVASAVVTFRLHGWGVAAARFSAVRFRWPPTCPVTNAALVDHSSTSQLE